MQPRPPTRPTPESILQHFRIHFSGTDSGTSLEPEFKSCLYFITARFERPWHRQPSDQLNEFSKLYYKLSRPLLGNHLNRKRRLQPLCYAFVDAEGSRVGYSEMFDCELPHIHALLLAPPEYRIELRRALQDPRLVDCVASLKTVDVKPFSENEGSVENLISYCMKGFVQASPSHFLREDLWAIFPR